MFNDQITLLEAILLVLFGIGENFKKMTPKEICEKLSELKWVSSFEETDVEDLLKDNEKMFKIEGDAYSVSDHGISVANNINFY